MVAGRDAGRAAGGAVAGVYAAVLTGALLPEGRMADPQIPGGLWIRPSWPAEHVAAERAGLTDLPRPPVSGLIVVGMTGRRVPPPLWPGLRRAPGQVPPRDRAALRVRAS